VYADHLFVVCDEGPSSLQVMDLRFLPDSVHVVYDDNTLFARVHNIEIDTVNARMYTCGGSSQFSIFSIADPAAPELLVNCEASFPWWNGAIGYVHDCFVRDNIVWTNDQDALHVIDFSDPFNPEIIGALTSYPDQGYNHSGWMNDAGTLYAMADETHGSPLKFIDATDPSDLNILSTVTSGVDPTSILHNPFFTGDRVHVAYYYDGYWAWDAANPQMPELLGYYDTNSAPNANGFRGAWGVYPYLPSGNILVSDMQTGLWVLAYDTPTGMNSATVPPAFRIAPTVTSGTVRVQAFKEDPTSTSIEVINSNGQVVRTTPLGNLRSLEVDLADLADGTYLIAVGTGVDRYTQRVIKTSLR
jgi:choice-of-anchor B domain-containing protein